MSENKGWVGKEFNRKEDHRLTTGRGKYLAHCNPRHFAYRFYEKRPGPRAHQEHQHQHGGSDAGRCRGLYR